MCAIFGLLDYKGGLTAAQRQRLVKALGTAAEVRGTDATGIAFFQRNRLCIQKAAKPAHKMRYRIPAETRVIMGHTRMTTQGSAKKNQNNHPFPGKAGGMAFALAHNGVLVNDRELRHTNKLPDTNIETDSYIAVQLMEQQKELTFHSLQKMAETVEGSFVFTVLNQDNNVYFIKGTNPLTIYHYPNPGLYLYASTEPILFSALAAVGMEHTEPEVIEPEEGTILMIDHAGQQTWSQFNLMGDYRPWTRPWDWETACHRQRLQMMETFHLEYIQELKNIAGCCGYSAEEIDNLLADGYTTDDIEAMLY